MARGDRDIIVVESGGSGGVKWLLLGAAVGAGLALLFAPKSGKDVRRELGRGLRSLRDLADDTFDELKEGEEGTDNAEGLAADLASSLEDDAPEPPAPRKTKNRPSQISARDELERRLAAARARRRQPVLEEDEEPVA